MNLFLKENNEEFKGEVDVVSGVKTVPESQVEQRDALRQILASQEPQPLEHVPSTITTILFNFDFDLTSI